MKKYFLFSIALILFYSADSQLITSKQIDSLAELTLKTFNVPGIAVGVIKDGKLVHMIERHQIEGRPAQMIAQNLISAFEQYC